MVNYFRETLLPETAYALAEEILDGKWDHISAIKTGPAAASEEIVGELRRRCPGFSVSEYQEELARCLHAAMK